MDQSDSGLLPDYVLRTARGPMFQAITDAYGLYNTEQFVLRLSPLTHRRLADATPGIQSGAAHSGETIRAMSTFLHETIHWWQHIGSTYGFIFSLIYPVQAHCTHYQLKSLVEQSGFKKSVFLQALRLNEQGPSGYGTTAGLANTIVNNHFDLLAFRKFTIDPNAAKTISQQPLFEAVGHAFHMTYAHVVSTIASTVDKEFSATPHPKEWEEGFRDLRIRRVDGFYYGSPIDLYPLGSRQIFEGQACFSQLQYLSNAGGHRYDWDDYRRFGLLHGVYESAFKEFLRLTESDWPDRIDDPLVGLFLLVCDLSLNPGSGFPFHVIPNFESFIEDVHPGARFSFFSRLIFLKFQTMKGAINRYSHDEYEELSGELCNALKERSPSHISGTFAQWFAERGPFSQLRSEYLSYRFSAENYAIRHLFAHFLAFQEDKFAHPEFFCWPGAWMAGDRVDATSATLFDKHGALFVDKEDNDGVFARLQAARDPAIVQKTFEKFYHNAVTYGFADQWISRPGPFRFDLGWIKPEATASEVRSYMMKQFDAVYGLDLTLAEIMHE